MKIQLHKQRPVLISKPSTPIQAEAEVEVVVAKMVAEQEINSNKLMIINNNTQVAEVKFQRQGELQRSWK